MGAFLTSNAITGRFRDLVAAARTGGTQGFFDLDWARSVAQGFDNSDSYDIQDFAGLVEKRTALSDLKRTAGELLRACNAARIDFTALGRSVSRSTGLAFWFPGSARSFDATADAYARLAFNEATGWTDYLKQYRSTPNGEPSI